MRDHNKKDQGSIINKIDDLGSTLNILFEDGTRKPSHTALSLTPNQLEKLRRSVPLKIDALGKWWHAGDKFIHQRLIKLFNSGLDMMNGESIVKVGERWCYIDCDRTPFLVLKIQIDHDESSNTSQLYACLNNEERLPLCSLSIYNKILFTQLTPTRYARFSQHAQAQCMEWLIQDEQTQCFELHFYQQRLVIKEE
jgi:hypothetical protein